MQQTWQEYVPHIKSNRDMKCKNKIKEEEKRTTKLMLSKPIPWQNIRMKAEKDVQPKDTRGPKTTRQRRIPVIRFFLLFWVINILFSSEYILRAWVCLVVPSTKWQLRLNARLEERYKFLFLTSSIRRWRWAKPITRGSINITQECGPLEKLSEKGTPGVSELFSSWNLGALQTISGMA